MNGTEWLTAGPGLFAAWVATSACASGPASSATGFGGQSSDAGGPRATDAAADGSVVWGANEAGDALVTDGASDATRAGDAGDAGDAGGSSEAGDCGAPVLATQNARGGDAPVYVNAATYDYSPSVMLDGVYRMWWCCGGTSGGVAGDHICYAEGSALDGPWHARASTTANTHDEVFHGTGNVADFDGTHTCDPSVVRVEDGTYYMFYGGISESTPTPTWTRIGVASSPDGFAWTRLNGGKAIVDAARDPYSAGLPNKYGAGQPSVVSLGGAFYLIHTDTTGVGGNQGNGAGQYVLRSADPTFQTGVDELSATGFVARGKTTYTGYSLVEAFGADWQYVDTIDAFAIADDGADPTATVLHFFTRALDPLHDDQRIPGHWSEEPALVSRPDRHAVPWGGACGTIAMDVVRSVGTGGQPNTWDLAHDGVDIATGLPCACVPLGRMLEGTLLSVPSKPLTLVRGGGRLQFALAPPAVRLARTSVDPGVDVFDALPYAASVFSSNMALGATGKPGAYLLDDGRLWPVSCLAELTDDSTTLTAVGVVQYTAYAQGPSLYCLQ